MVKQITSEETKKTLVINAYGGPGAGKSTAALDIVSSLKKRGIVAEYVSEYAKELVWEGNTELLNGTSENQHILLQEQYNRQKRLIGKCDIIVTDSPLILNINYNKELTSEYRDEVVSLYNEFNNFEFVIKRDESQYEEAGRLQTLDEAKILDKEILKNLDELGITYGIYNHSNIDKIVDNAIKVFYALNANALKKENKLTGATNSIEQCQPKWKKTKEEYVAAQHDKLNDVNKTIAGIAMNYCVDPIKISELCEFASKFYKYSAKNTMLIKEQNKGATFVQSFESWKKDGYNVIKGQKGIKILVPVAVTYIKIPETDEYIKLSDAPKKLQMLYKQNKVECVKKQYYTVGNVFDISQTTCPVEKYPDYYNMGYKDVNQDLICRGIENFSKSELDIPIRTQDVSSISLRGYYIPDTEIVINDKLNSTERLSTITHELGHAIMEHSTLDEIKSSFQREFEADCFSIMFDKHLGIEITEARKAHLANNFRLMDSDFQKHDKSYNLDNIINDVMKQFSDMVDTLDKYIDYEISMKNAKDISDEIQEDEAAELSDFSNKQLNIRFSMQPEAAPELGIG